MVQPHALQVSKHHSSCYLSLCIMICICYVLKLCSNIYISHQCFSNSERESWCAVPSSCQWVRLRSLTAQRQVMRDKPYQLPNLFHHEVGVVRGARPVCYASNLKPHASAAMKVCIVESRANMAVSFHVLSTGVYLCPHCSHPYPAKPNLKPWLVGLQLL